MSDKEIPVHLKFSFATAIKEIKKIVYNFDFKKRVGDSLYTNIYAPSELIEVIDGIIDDFGSSFGESIRQLRDIKQSILNGILLDFNQGKLACKKTWKEATSDQKAILDALSNSDIHDLGNQNCPTDKQLSARSWFIEGYCKEWIYQWKIYLQDQNDNGLST